MVTKKNMSRILIKKNLKDKGITQSYLKKEYILNGKPITKLAKEMHISQNTLRNYLRYFGIHTRTTYQSWCIRNKTKEFDIDNIHIDNWKALAWALDCDGSIGLQSYNKRIPAISIAMTSEKFINMLIVEFPNLWYKCSKRYNTMRDYTWEMFTIKINSRELIQQILPKIIPFLVIKKEIAILLLKFCELRTQSRKRTTTEDLILETIKQMNKKKVYDKQKEIIYDKFLEEYNKVY